MSSESECKSDSKDDLLNYEEKRIKSFASWPVHYPVDPVRLAKAGFYYTGTEDEVVCFSCQGHIKNWNFGDIVLKKHSDLYPDCDFIRNVSNNVPLSKNFVESELKSCNIKNSSDIIQFDVDYEKMKFVIARMKSFNCGKWLSTNINIADLAYAGYFYTGVDDKLQCAFCKVLVEKFEVNKALCGEYLKHFPWCDHLADQSRRTIKENTGRPWYKISPSDVCGSMEPTEPSSDSILLVNKLINNKQHVNIEDLGVCLHNNPVHPYYASLMTRLKTFSSWPANATISKEDLAVAGFFHLGVDDRTVCFYCNGGLKTWVAGDDPWVEHARWFSSCEFVRLNKGSDFIIACLLESTSTFLNENDAPSTGSDTSESLLKKLNEAMASNFVRNLSESGIFTPYILRAAILLQIKQTGSNFSNSEDLCVAASYLKDKMEQQYFDEKSVKAEDLNICLKISKDLAISDKSEESSKMEQDPSPDTSVEKNLNKGEFPVCSGIIHNKASTVQIDEKNEHYLCKICMDKERGVVFLPCGHLPACTTCTSALKHCPMCREPIQATVRCFFD